LRTLLAARSPNSYG